MIFRHLVQSLWSHWEWTEEKRERGRVHEQQSKTFPLTGQIFYSSPDDMALQFPTPSQTKRKTLFRVGYQVHGLLFSGQKSGTIMNRGSKRAQPSPGSKFRAWGRLRWRASLGFETATRTTIIIRVTAVVTSATAPALSRFETCAGKPNGNEECFINELGEECGGN